MTQVNLLLEDSLNLLTILNKNQLYLTDNNSLGIRSPRKTSLKKSQLSIKNSSYKKIGRSVTTVTRNINSKHSSSTYKWQSGVPQKASQADQVIKRLVTHANNAAKPSYLSDTSSAPSSARLKLKPNKSLPLSKHQVNIFSKLTQNFLNLILTQDLSSSSVFRVQYLSLAGSLPLRNKMMMSQTLVRF